MDYGAVSKSDIDFDFDDSGSDSDISIATDASSTTDYDVVDQFEQSIALNDGEDVYEHHLRGDTTEDSDDFGPAIVVPLKSGSDHSSGESEPIDPGSRSSRSSRRGSFHRRPPTRTKSGEGMTTSTHSAASGKRRPPPRTKSGEGIPEPEGDGEGNLRRRPPRRTKSGSAPCMRRRPPPRTKSGSAIPTMSPNGDDDDDGGNNDGDDGDGDDDDDFVVDLPEETGAEEGAYEDNEYREKALSRNMARRQRSSDMLGAMREATRNVPSRSRSDASGITNGRRRGAGRTRSSAGELLANENGGDDDDDAIRMDSLATPGRKPLRRRAPPRTKSGGTLTAAPPLET